MSSRRVGVYVDSMNIMRNGGYGMRYEVIRRFVGRDGDEVMRLNAYVAIDEERAVADPNYKTTLNFILTLRDLGFKAIEKPIRWYTDDSGRTYGKANLDMEMGLDIVSQSDRLDMIYLFTGDGDFCSVVTMAQNKGCRVELVAFANVSGGCAGRWTCSCPDTWYRGCCPPRRPLPGPPPGERWAAGSGGCAPSISWTALMGFSGSCTPSARSGLPTPAWKNPLIPRYFLWKRTCRRGFILKTCPAGITSSSSPSTREKKVLWPQILI